MMFTLSKWSKVEVHMEMWLIPRLKENPEMLAPPPGTREAREGLVQPRSLSCGAPWPWPAHFAVLTIGSKYMANELYERRSYHSVLNWGVLNVCAAACVDVVHRVLVVGGLIGDVLLSPCRP